MSAEKELNEILGRETVLSVLDGDDFIDLCDVISKIKQEQQSQTERERKLYEALQILIGDVNRHPKPFSNRERIEIARQTLNECKPNKGE